MRSGFLLRLVLLTAAGTLLLAGNDRVSLLERDEAGFAARSAAMLRDLDWAEPSSFLAPVVYGQPYYNKPPLMFWLQLPVQAWLGPTNLAARFWSSVCGLLLLCVVYCFGRDLHRLGAGRTWSPSPQLNEPRSGGAWPLWDPSAAQRCGLLAAALLGASFFPLFIMKWGTTDAPLALLVTLINWLLFRWVFRRDASVQDRVADTGSVVRSQSLPAGMGLPWGMAAALVALLALSLLLKGPAGLVFLVPLSLVLWRVFGGWAAAPRLWMWGAGGAGAVVLALPLYWVSGQMEGGRSAQQFWLAQVLLRLVVPINNQGGPPGYYTAIHLVAAFPFALVLGWAVWPASVWVGKISRALWARLRGWEANLRAWPALPEPVSLFLLSASIPGWLILELLVVTKLPHYAMGAWPMFALLAAWRITAWADPLAGWTSRSGELPGRWWCGGRGRRALRVGLHASGVLVVLVLAGLGVWAGDAAAGAAGLCAAALLGLAGGRCTHGADRRAVGRSILESAALAAAGWVLVWSFVLPGLEPYRLERRAADAVVSVTLAGERVVMTNWQAFSVAYYVDRPIRFVQTVSRRDGSALRPPFGNRETLVEALRAEQASGLAFAVLLDRPTVDLIARDEAFRREFAWLAEPGPGWTQVEAIDLGSWQESGPRRAVWIVPSPR